MAVYKVPQDIEAEDKLVGPLTLKQFIYAGVTALCLYLSFIALTKHAAYLLSIFMPIALLAGFLAFPWSREQPTEIWLLAKIRFFFKPHRRIWDQTGVRELVTITAPKKVEHNYTNGLTQSEVKSRLHALADTIDSRGWAVKNVNVNLYGQPSQLIEETGSDRLIDVSALPQDVPNVDVNPSDDIFQGTVADHFGQMITATDQAHRQQIMQQMHQAAVAQMPKDQQAQQNDYWFLHQGNTSVVAGVPRDYMTFASTPVVHPGTTEDDMPVAEPTPGETAFAKKLKAKSKEPEQGYAHLKTIQPLTIDNTSPSISNTARPASPTPVTQPPDADILNLANDNDKNVATIARMANEATQKRKPEPPADEVVISLH